MIKRTVKSALRGVAATIGPHRWRRGPCLLVLTYHRVLPGDHPARETEQPGMLVSPELLAMHFEVLKRHFRPVHLDEWLSASTIGKPPLGRSVAVTFDDGWRDNYDYAFPVLKAANMPATIFLVTDLVGSLDQFWPNRLARLLKAWTPKHHIRLDPNTQQRAAALDIPLDLPSAHATPDLIDTIISRCKVADDTAMHALLDRLEAAMLDEGKPRQPVEERELLDWNEVRAMDESRLVRFGSHTRRHIRLRDDTPTGLLEDEICGSKRTLEETIGSAVELFCYPNGDLSQRAYRLVKRHYAGAVSTQSGWNRHGRDPWLIRRIGIHEDVSKTRVAFLGRLSAWPGL